MLSHFVFCVFPAKDKIEAIKTIDAKAFAEKKATTPNNKFDVRTPDEFSSPY
jgi:hypothetical protein